MRMRPIAFMNMAAALLFAGVLGMTVARTAPVAASSMPEGVTEPQAPTPAPQAKPAATPPPAQTAPSAPAPGYAGQEACTTCHSGYEASIKASKHGQAMDPRTPAAAQGCESCHGPGEAHMNDPEKVKPMQFNKLAAREVTQVCATCHNKGPHAQWKGSQHESRNVSCTTCHSVHHPKSPTAQLKQVDQQMQCMSCHRDKVA